jgi:hypothetical protein
VPETVLRVELLLVALAGSVPVTVVLDRVRLDIGDDGGERRGVTHAE